MQTKIYNLDKGESFGLWNDKTSRLMYFDSVGVSLSGIDTSSMHVADYGGANSILKQIIKCKKYTCIDIDTTKQPDITDSILTHVGQYDLIIVRYVLHYLSDNEIMQLISHIRSFHRGLVLIIQFCNENRDLQIKWEISKQAETGGEQKYFRNKKHLSRLLKELHLINSIEVNYSVMPEFYQNRLGIKTDLSHTETILNLLYDVQN
jgi:hypothetical protein